MRYKLVPTRGVKRSVFVECDDMAAARAAAEERVAKIGVPVLLCEAPQDGVVFVKEQVPPDTRPRTRGRLPR